MRRITLLCALALLLAVAPPAFAQGGAAQCRQTVKLDGAQRVSSLSLPAGDYRITVLDTGDLTCDDARRFFREILGEPGGIIPKGWDVDVATQTFTRSDGTDSFVVAAVPPPAGSGGGLSWDDIQSNILLWAPILFLGVLSFAVLWMLRYMPRTKP